MLIRPAIREFGQGEVDIGGNGAWLRNSKSSVF